jgi:hypothetical protein
MAQIGVLHPRNVGITVEDALRIIHKRLELVLVAERFFQIHVSSPLAFKLFSEYIVMGYRPDVMELVVHPVDSTHIQN